MTDREMLELANEYLSYDHQTGDFTWIKSPNRRIAVGQKTGSSTNSDDYKCVCLKGQFVKAHRLAWMMHYGVIPDHIDHINGKRDDNKIVNLRSVSGQMNAQNQRNAHSNSSTGVLGVVPKKNGKYAAEIRVNGRKIHLGTFKTIDEASSVYASTKLKLHQGAVP